MTPIMRNHDIYRVVTPLIPPLSREGVWRPSYPNHSLPFGDGFRALRDACVVSGSPLGGPNRKKKNFFFFFCFGIICKGAFFPSFYHAVQRSIHPFFSFLTGWERFKGVLECFPLQRCTLI